MRRWTVGGALLEGPGGLLLVRNRRRNGRADWTPPGGVIDEGETVLGGLTREVAEETGLRVSEWEGPVYEIDALATGLGWQLRVEVHRAVAYEGELAIDDPDGIVELARFVSADECDHHLAAAHLWVREPLLAWLGERWSGTRRFGYRVDGDDIATLSVARVA
ncbi:MAG: NUDIX hydrolase [Actinomycetota bacterium]|nr:NUDIX hydrolase [Actinomycetota bacterium]